MSGPEQYQRLSSGRLDVGVGRAAFAPPGVAAHLFRRDPVGVLVPDGHRFAAVEEVPVAALAGEPVLLAEEAQAPELNQFTIEMCRAAGFAPTVYGGTEDPRYRATRARAEDAPVHRTGKGAIPQPGRPAHARALD